MLLKSTPKTLFGVALATALLAQPALAQEPAGGDDTLIATINGEPYSLDLFRAFYAQRLQQAGSESSPQLQERVFNEFMNLVVAAQEADARDLADQPDVQTSLALQRMLVLSQAALQAIAADTEVSEDELQQAYEQFKEQAKRTEYKARHILVDEQEKAQELAEQVAEPGQWTEQPVQTQFGWHVILLEETRNAEPPAFADAKPQLEAAVKRQKVAARLTEMRNQAMVDLNEDVVKLKEEEDGQ